MMPSPTMMPAAMERPTFNSLLQGIGVLDRSGEWGTRISCIVTDSRRIIPGALFFALPGLRSNGHAFLDDAIARGAAAVISGEPVGGLPAVAAAQKHNAVHSRRPRSAAFRASESATCL